MKSHKSDIFSLNNTSINDWNSKKVESKHLTLFHSLSPLKKHSALDRFKTIEPKLEKIKNHDIANPTEQQSVTHHECRKFDTADNQKLLNIVNKYSKDYSYIGKNKITHICQIGIGGSNTGPKTIHHTLKSWGYNEKYKGNFISNHDEHHIEKKLAELPISSTLFIIASKSGTTIEIIKTIATIIKKIKIPKKTFYKNQCITITTKNSPLNSNEFSDCLIFEESIGGRFSTTSPIGTLMLGLCFGEKVIKDFLSGAHEMDKIELSNNLVDTNIAFQMAHLNVKYRNKYNLNQLAIIPYGYGLKYLNPFLLQLISESLGKNTTLDGEKSSLNNCPNILTEVGPGAQHSIFQQIHQASTMTPCEFIFAKPTTPNQTHILQQIIGQMIALAHGNPSENNHHNFSGNRPSLLIYLKEQTANALGALIATYENRVMFESLILNINAFDQPGVELGKKLTRSISESKNNLATQIYQSFEIKK